MKKFLSLTLTLLLLFALPFATAAAGEEKIVANGIDVSSTGQGGKTDFQKVKSSGVDFVILAAGFSGNGKGDKPSTDTSTPPTIPSTYFERDYANATAAGLKIGVYYYSYAKTVAEAECDAADCLRFVKNKQLEYPIYYDMEDEEYQGDLTTAQRTAIALAFTRKVQAAGYLAGVYASKNWFTNYLNLSAIEKECEIWWAQYPYSGKPDMDYSAHGLWQYASDGKVNGVFNDDGSQANVDVNVAYKDYPTLVRLTGLNGFNKSQDYNCDGKTDLKDATLMAHCVAGYRNLTLNAYNGNPPSLKNVVTLLRSVLQ